MLTAPELFTAEVLDFLWAAPPDAGNRGGDGRSDEVYTLGAWRVKDGMQEQFVVAWKELGRFFLGLPHPLGTGTLLQSLDDPQQFYSFGPWRTLEDIRDMRSHPDAPSEIGRLMDLCEEGRPGTFRVVPTA